MNNLIAISDFKGKYILPNALSANKTSFYNDSIADAQKEFLILLLGYHFYSQLDIAVTASELETNPVVLNQKWTDLIDGKDVIIDEITYRYNGLKQLVLIYAWIYIISKGVIDVADNGLFVASSENSERIDPTVYMVNRWNELMALIDEPISVYQFIEDSTEEYPAYQRSANLNYRSWL